MRLHLAQLNSTADPQRNLGLVKTAIESATAAGADLLVLPEAVMSRFGVPLTGIAEPLDGPWASGVRSLARAAGIVVVAGMFTPAADGRVRNTLLITGPGVDTHYDKIHLYDAFGFAESDTVAPGAEPVTFDVAGVTVGVATCYDLRFPGLFQELARRGAVCTVVSASWGSGPGKVDQWQLLGRARALDATTYVAACGQADPAANGEVVTGKAPLGVGHSQVVAPDGQVLQTLDGAAGFLTVDIDPSRVSAVREQLPVLANRRW